MISCGMVAKIRLRLEVMNRRQSRGGITFLGDSLGWLLERDDDRVEPWMADLGDFCSKVPRELGVGGEAVGYREQWRDICLYWSSNRTTAAPIEKYRSANWCLI